MIMSNLTGQTIKTYTIKEEIGAGGFGAVYRALQQPIDREVAVKVILPEHANQPEFVRRFETEAQLVARLEHPHIVPLYDYWRDPSGAYIVMRYLKGGSLRDSLEVNEVWSLTRVARMLNQIAAALTFAHQHHVVHRDLKFDNILLDEEGNAYLSDFGIAKDLGGQINMTKDAILGTPAYLAPEQIRGEIASAQSDIYALGIMVFEALAGEKPFYDLTPATVLFKQLNDPLPDVTKMRDNLPSQVNDVLQRATSKDSTLRYEHAIDFARALTETIDPSTVDNSVSISLDLVNKTSEIIEANNPYKGLRAFQQADASEFYGRDVLINRLLSHMQAPETNSFLAVIGPSGSGKSSVIKAGVLPRIQERVLDNSRDWFVVEMVPGTHPLEELEAALLSIATEDIHGMLSQLQNDTRGLARAAKRILPTENAELVLYIDQFEEIFTMVESEAERTHFLESLVETSLDVRSRVHVIISMRADFYDRPLLYSEFGELIRTRTQLVLPLTKEELQETIIKPAENVGINLEQGLVDAIIRDVSQQPGALPLLQYALTELFERRNGNYMTLDAYHDIGGTAGALARRAEEVYTEFDDDKREATRQLFMRLVSLGEGTEDTRRRVLQAELLSISNQSELISDIVDKFGRYRLLTFDHDPATRSSTVEVAHEALIRQWERMKKWLDENREGLRLQRRLTIATEEWYSSEYDRSYLARGTRLKQFEELNISSDFALNDRELEYINESIVIRDELLREEEARKLREEELEKQAQRRQRYLAITMGVAGVIGIALAIIALIQSNAAAEALVIAQDNEEIALNNAAEAQSLALAANARNAQSEGDSQLALALAIEASNAFEPASAEILRVMSSTAYNPGPRFRLDEHDGSIMDSAYSPDGGLIASASLDGTIHTWDTETGELLFTYTIENGSPLKLDYSPDGQYIAISLLDGRVIILDAQDELRLIQDILAHDGLAHAVTFHPTENIVASGGDDNLIKLWDIATASQVRVLSGHTGAVVRLDFNSDGSRLVSSSVDDTLANDRNDTVDRTIRVWNTQTGEQQLLINPESGFVRALDFSNNDQMIAMGVWDSGNSGTARIYDANTGEEIRRLFAHTTPLTDVRFNKDDTQLVTTAWDNVMRIWDIERGVELNSFVGFDGRLLSATFSPDGEHIAITTGNVGDNIATERSDSSSIWIWDITPRDQQSVYRGHNDWLWTADISPDGTLAASGSGPLRLPDNATGEQLAQIDTSVHIWNIETGETIHILEAHGNTVDSVLFLPDGNRLLSAGWDGLLILWDIETGERIQLYRDPAHEGQYYKMALNSDGSQFAVTSNDGLVRLWDTETAELLQTFDGHGGQAVNGVDFSNDDTLLVTSGSDTLVHLWDITSGSIVQTMTGHTSSVNEAKFNPDNTLIVTSSWDDTIRFWSVATGTEIRQLTGHNGNTFGLAFSADGQVLLSTSQDTSVRMWDVDSGEELHRFNSHTDWIQEVILSPDGTFAISAGQDNSVRVWRIARTPAELTSFAENNRYIYTLTCTDRELYRLELCEQ